MRAPLQGHRRRQHTWLFKPRLTEKLNEIRFFSPSTYAQANLDRATQTAPRHRAGFSALRGACWLTPGGRPGTVPPRSAEKVPLLRQRRPGPERALCGLVCEQPTEGGGQPAAAAMSSSASACESLFPAPLQGATCHADGAPVPGAEGGSSEQLSAHSLRPLLGHELQRVSRERSSQIGLGLVCTDSLPSVAPSSTEEDP